MTNKVNESENQFDYLFKLELRGQPIPDSSSDKVVILKKRSKKVNLLIGANFIFVSLFFISHQYGVTRLSMTWLYVLSGVFVLNLLMLFKQKSAISKAVLFFSTR